LYYINCGILLEAIVRGVEKRSPIAGRAMTALVIAAFAVRFFSYIGWHHLFDFNSLHEQRRRVEFAVETISRRSRDLPVFVIPKEAFFYYLHEKENSSPFNRSLVEDPDFLQIASPSHETVLQWRNLLTVFTRTNKPLKLPVGSFKVFQFSEFVGVAQSPDIHAFRNSDCKITRENPSRGFVEMYCVPSGKGTQK
jgi:hypothetical protein